MIGNLPKMFRYESAVSLLVLLVANRKCELNVCFKVKGGLTNTGEAVSVVKKNRVVEAMNVPVLPVLVKFIKHELEETVHSSVEKYHS